MSPWYDIFLGQAHLNLTEEQIRKEMEGFIKDEEEEEEEEGEESGSESGKRKHEDSESDDQLEEEDYDLIEENLGVKVKRKVSENYGCGEIMVFSCLVIFDTVGNWHIYFNLPLLNIINKNDFPKSYSCNFGGREKVLVSFEQCKNTQKRTILELIAEFLKTIIKKQDKRTCLEDVSAGPKTKNT